jgi:hypothetical protein
MKKKKIKMMNLFKDRANIFDKISFGISLIPIFTMITMFTQFFREGLVVNGIHFADGSLYSAIWDVTLDFFSRISGFQIFIIGALFVYQMWFIVNYCVTKLDGRRKKRTHDFGLFLLCCSVWVSIIMFALIFILAIWDFKWLTVWFFGLLKSFQPMTSVIIIALILALIYIIVSIKYIVTKGFDKYLKECEKSDYEFSKMDLFIGITKILVILLFAVIVSFKFINIIM